MAAPLACIFGCLGTSLTDDERRMIFPDLVLGSALVNRISSGLAMAPISLVTWLRSSSFSASVG
jgi:hypothetical protein